MNAPKPQTIEGMIGTLANGEGLVSVPLPYFSSALLGGQIQIIAGFCRIHRHDRTMLEQTSLLLRPWKAAPSGESDRMVRAVVDGDGATVGFVRQQPGGPRWLRWLNRRTLKAYETPDGSLVFALRRSWGWPAGWHIVDADERLVGRLRGRRCSMASVTSWRRSRRRTAAAAADSWRSKGGNWASMLSNRKARA